MNTAAVASLFGAFGYNLHKRTNGWTDVVAVRGSERWEGVSFSEDDAIENLVARMFPSRVARELLRAALAATKPAAPVQANGTATNGTATNGATAPAPVQANGVATNGTAAPAPVQASGIATTGAAPPSERRPRVEPKVLAYRPGRPPTDEQRRIQVRPEQPPSSAATSALGGQNLAARIATRKHGTRAACSAAMALRSLIFSSALLLAGVILAVGPLCSQARADPSFELSGVTGFGVLVAGVTSARFAISPGASFSVRGERGFFVARDTVSFLGAAGGRFGINNELTLGGGLFWEQVNVSLGLSLSALSLPICGPQLCGQVRGVVPGASARVDFFGPYLSGALGASVDCAGTWITGDASPVWNGVSLRCSAGPIVRFVSRP